MKKIKHKKYNYFIIGVTIICSLITISSLAIDNKEASNLIINYENKVILEDNKNNEVRVKEDKIDTSVRLLPIPDIDEIIILDAL